MNEMTAEEMALEDVLIGDDQLATLAELAELDISDVDPWRGYTQFPVGMFHWRVQSSDLSTQDTKSGKRAVMSVTLECLAVEALQDKTLNPADYIGEVHQERIMIFDLDKSVGQMVALMQDAGFQGKGTFLQLMRQFGESKIEFKGGIKHRRDKDDPDKVYANLDPQKIRPAVVSAAVGVASAGAAATPATPARSGGLAIGGRK